MNTISTELDRRLCRILCDHPKNYNNRFTTEAKRNLIETLFRALTNDREHRFQALFPNGLPESGQLQDVQKVQEGTEYTAAAKGHACGHILKAGEATYHCMTCTDDATCVLCARCFSASDHEGHQFHVNTSPGNNGCCDCGDAEAFKRPVNCAIHTATGDEMQQDPRVCLLPEDLQRSISATIARALDYFCDVISCSPENLRLPKTEESVKHDEGSSRLSDKWYSPGDEYEANPEFCLVLWNDEKHTVEGVAAQISRACRERYQFGLDRANEVNDIGRSVLRHSRNIKELIKMCRVLEQIKVTVTIRSSRDTFREQMCSTIIEWLSDIACCSIQDDHFILRQVVCQEMTKEWRIGSEASNAAVGKDGLFDNEKEDNEAEQEKIRRFRRQHELILIAQQNITLDAFEDDEDDEDQRPIDGVDTANGDDDEAEDEDEEDDQNDEVAARPRRTALDISTMIQTPVPADLAPAEADSGNEGLDGTEDGEELDTDGDFMDVMDIDVPAQNDARGEVEVGPPPLPAVVFTPTESETGDVIMGNEQREANTATPRLPDPNAPPEHEATPEYWTRNSSEYSFERMDPLAASDAVERMRLDSLILFDLRLWKETRIKIRDLLISTIVNIAHFKRIFGIRFALLYTTLSQLYLVADREPDHSVIHLSLQMLTSPSITEEVIDKGDFLTTLMAILYTFLTTRQVGYPKDVDSQATLAFDTGSVTNRRLLSSFNDLRYILASDFVQRKVRSDARYLKQFLDLAKLSQGICPNTRAVGEHVEYETDAWINAALLTKEMNKLCREFAESYREKVTKQVFSIEKTSSAVFDTACVVIVNSIGLERKRFTQCEIKEVTRFKTVKRFEFETRNDPSTFTNQYRIVDFVVQDGALSFHHALHYTLSWLIEFAKSSNRALAALDAAALRVVQDLQKVHEKLPPQSTFFWKDDALLAMFDYPLRLCAWLAQMKAGMWVRNGVSLKHQWVQYRAVLYRDVGHHRDLVLLQTALVACEPGRVLASMIDRYGLDDWMRGDFTSPSWREEGQSIDLAEEFLFLLINLLSDRDNLIPQDEDTDPHMIAVRKDIVHTLCFKPMSFSELNARLTERRQDHQELQDVLDVMTTYRPPEGLHDSGMFELKPEFLRELDPYNSNFSKNQRDEAEAIYRRWMSKSTGKAPEDIVLEPHLRPIKSGVFTQLTAVTRTPLFAQVIYYCLEYAMEASISTPDIPVTRIEALLHVVLQLALIATLEDELDEDFDSHAAADSFVYHALRLGPKAPRSGRTAIVTILQQISNMEEYESCRAKIKHLLRMFVRKRETEFKRVTAHLEFPYGRLDTASPANLESEVEAKKKQALERKAKVMAQFQQQQQSFLDNQGTIDWGEDDFSDVEPESATQTEEHTWKYPSGVCIHCREDVTADCRLYGTFAMVAKSGILRRTPNFSSTPSPPNSDAQLPSVKEHNSNINRLAADLAQQASADELNRIREALTDQQRQLGVIRNIDPLAFHFRAQAMEQYMQRISASPRHKAQETGSDMRDYIREVFESPSSLDASLEDCRPFGISSWNHEIIKRLNASGEEIETDRQCLGKGWPKSETAVSRIMTSCGHIMHFSCFTNYYASITRRQSHQISRNHPERLSQLEFVCPLCKAAGNTFLPIAWKSIQESYPGVLQADHSLNEALWVEINEPYSEKHSRREQQNEEAEERLIAAYRNSRSGLAVNINFASQQNPEDLSVTELQKIFNRLRDVPGISATGRVSGSGNAQALTRTHVEALTSCFADTIAAAEAAHRGIQSDYGLTLLSKVPPQTLTHLKILASDISLYIAIKPSVGPHAASGDIRPVQAEEELKLFCRYTEKNALCTLPFLMEDSFTHLAQASFTLYQVSKLKPHHMLRICYTAELFRVIMSYCMVDSEFQAQFPDEKGVLEEMMLKHTASPESADAASLRGIADFFEFYNTENETWRGRRLSEEARQGLASLTPVRLGNNDGMALLRLLRPYATAFLRKAVILFNVAHSVDFPLITGSEYALLPELERLEQVLNLPSMGTMLSEMSPYIGNSPIKTLASGWLAHYFGYSIKKCAQDLNKFPEGTPEGQMGTEEFVLEASARAVRDLTTNDVYPRIPLLHPCPLELIGLPKYFDVLMDLAYHRRCPTTGRDLTDPALCLLCGDIFCAQAACCMKDGKLGGCNRHITETGCGGGTIGMFLFIRKCMVGLLHVVPSPTAGNKKAWLSNGAWFQAPYLTRHGEHDQGLRTREQLILNQKRYDKLYREAWLCVRGGSEIWSMIARKLEGDVNHGGWETL
jgi:E3 ubiquitin-protein ligase UBR1